MGLPVPSVGPQIAECQKVLEASGLEYKVSSLSSFCEHEVSLIRTAAVSSPVAFLRTKLNDQRVRYEPRRTLGPGHEGEQGPNWGIMSMLIIGNW